MLPFGVTTVEFALVTFVSALVGILVAIGASRYIRSSVIAAFALGIYLWYFTDTLGDANYLGVNSGPAASAELYSLVVLFVIGVIAFFALDGSVFSLSEGLSERRVLVACLAALALGLHGFGEGADFGFTAAQTPTTSLLGAFGGLAEGASWALHKLLEPMIAAAIYVALTGGKPRRASERLVDALALTGVFAVPAVVGAATGYFVVFDHTYAFALGLGASTYALGRLGKPLIASGDGAQRWLSFKMALALVIGFLLIFLAALLHS